MAFEEMQQVLTEIADSLPQAIYRELNGGIILLPEYKLHPEGVQDNLYILGEYHFEPRGFGRYITIYYGSLCRAHGHLPREEQVQRLRVVLHHELTHHLEHLAGDKSLEVQDAAELARYRARYGMEQLYK